MALDVHAYPRHTSEQFEDAQNRMGTRYQLVSLSVYGNPWDPRYAHVWIKRKGSFPPQRILLDVPEGQVEETLFAQALERYRPALVSAASRYGHETTFAFLLEQSYHTPLFAWDLSQGRGDITSISNIYRKPAVVNKALGRRYMRSITHYYDKSNRSRFAATFDVQPIDRGDASEEFFLWNVTAGDDVADFQRKFDAYAESPAPVRPEYVVPYRYSLTPALANSATTEVKYAAVWMGNRLPGWSLHLEVHLEDYDALVEKQRSTYGMVPIRIQATGWDTMKRYAILFATDDQPIRRTYRPKALLPKTNNKVFVEAIPFRAWDTMLENMMKDYGIRGAQIAVTHQRRLVYARAATWAEDDYEDIDHDTAFCIGSVSKALTATAALIAAEKTTPSWGWPWTVSYMKARAIPIWDVLGPFEDNAFAGVTLHHCITQTSGNVGRCNLEASNFSVAGAADKVDRYITLLQGDKDAGFDLKLGTYTYCGLNPMLAGAAIAVMERTTTKLTYVDAMNKLLFEPLGIKRARVATSYFVGPGEAIRHNAIPTLDIVGLLQPTYVEVCYGRRDMDFIAPAGGWAMPATDLVRIISALDTYASPTGFSTPFSKDICFAMGALVPGVVDDAEPKPNSVLVTEAGWYVSRSIATDPTKPAKLAVDNKVISHNGAVDGSNAIAARDRRGNAFAIVLNTDYYRTTGVEGAMAEDTIESLLADLSKAAQKAGLQFSWPDYDLFPQVGPW